MDGGRRHAAALVGEAGGEMPSAPRPAGPPAQLSSRVVALSAHLCLVSLRSRNRVEHARRHPRAAPSRDAYEIVPLPSQEGRWAWRPRDLAACEKFFPFSSWRWGGGRSLGTPTRGWPAHGLPAPSRAFSSTAGGAALGLRSWRLPCVQCTPRYAQALYSKLLPGGSTRYYPAEYVYIWRAVLSTEKKNQNMQLPSHPASPIGQKLPAAA